MQKYTWLIGVDGGGTGTRVALGDTNGAELARASAGPSGLGLGIERAWQSIEEACRAAFAQAGLAFDWSQCVLGCGLAGVNNPDWQAAFRAAAPPVAGLAVESDVYTTVLGAHAGAQGVAVALGTGSIAAALDEHGQCRIAGGFGFPSGDEASGAWFGLRAIAWAQQALDARAPMDDFARALLAHVHASDRESLIVWQCAANQTAYASLAPVVLAHREHPFVAKLLAEAGVEIAKLITALDPSARLPVALSGGLGQPLREWVPQAVRDRLRAPFADSTSGALRLAQQEARRLAGG
ncbi:N-acetylglucosamine kinase of eukaryotic type [Paraburkholderia unamae]|uniref:BadF/BadG/BcrA/BcrD ATPase family protein n=1 Tax=Paraburkholderia unamae TaxID=219649 RepID=UPI000DC3A236|nr:BadF/BadG/BcrA/BcrD ATPase family protein [Paraburkholderia unamae]RAR66705.1 glucosamine kinase [Paraburkholderia unamae]CAG9274095.1 N-acetylglucosamine kinase of eukaryotic type [Paraburkholderia unamae]